MLKITLKLSALVGISCLFYTQQMMATFELEDPAAIIYADWRASQNRSQLPNTADALECVYDRDADKCICFDLETDLRIETPDSVCTELAARNSKSVGDKAETN